MSFSFIGNPSLTLAYSTPNLTETNIGIQTAKWQGDARVNVKDEHGTKWRIGFAQLLEKNMMQAVYRNHVRSEVLVNGASMPVLDSDGTANYRPFYDDNTATDIGNRPKDVETTVNNSEQVVRVKMWDEPESDYDWWFNNDENDPIEEFVMNLKFSTYILARDITNGSLDNGPYTVKILKQWAVQLDRRYKFTVVKKTGGGLRADITQSKCVILNPSRQPSVSPSSHQFPQNVDAIFSGQVANDVFVDHDTVSGAKRIGMNVRRLAAMFGGT
jgi:hypothetical protein